METVGTLLAFAAMVAFFVGLVSLFKPLAWARIPNRKTAGVVMAASFVAFMIGGAFIPAAEDEILSASRATSTSTTASAEATPATPTTSTSTAPTTTATVAPTSTTTAAPATTVTPSTTTTTTQPPIPEYIIVAEEDISYAGAVRYSLRVAVEAGTTRDGLRTIAEQIAAEYRGRRQYNALNILFYHHEEVAYDIASLGVWDDSPFGDWSRAAEVALGDYSTHQPNDKTKEKDWSLRPTQRQAKLYAAFLEAVYEIDTIDDDVLIEAAAERTGATVTEIEGAVDAFLDWVFNDIS